MAVTNALAYYVIGYRVFIVGAQISIFTRLAKKSKHAVKQLASRAGGAETS